MAIFSTLLYRILRLRHSTDPGDDDDGDDDGDDGDDGAKDLFEI